MNAFVKKEIRLLLPGFLAGLPLVLLTWRQPEWGASSYSEKMSGLCLLFGAVLALVLGTFGREFSSGTFSMLLSQPVSRIRIWGTKILILAAMTISLWAIWFAIRFLYHPSVNSAASLRDTGIFTLLFILALYSGGLWSVLLFRQVTAAFWFTALPPAAIWVVIECVSTNSGWHEMTGCAESVALIVYGGGGFLFAMRLFMHGQDAQWTGGHIEISLPGLQGWARRGVRTRRRRRARTALLVKEMQLHQSQFVIAGMLALLHLGAIAARNLGTFTLNSSLKAVLDGFWMLWLLMPLLIGCAAVAEERKMATLEGQLCLPAKRRTQFVLKFLIVILLSVVLGGVVPSLLEGGRISFWMLAGISTGVATMAFYASTLARYTLQALAPAVLLILSTIYVFIAAYLPEVFIHVQLWRGPLIYVVGAPVVAGIMAARAYSNYQRIVPGWSAWRKNLLTLFGALVLGASCTAAIYHRPWELVSPIEPTHGTARLSPGQAHLSVNEEDITAILPDGRAWVGRYYVHFKTWPGSVYFSPDFSVGGKFLDGTNWADVMTFPSDVVGLERDGTLWINENPFRPQDYWQGSLKIPETTTIHSASMQLSQMGNDHDWKSIQRFGGSVILLKSNGTLWIWGSRDRDWSWNQGLRDFPIERLGTDSDWAEYFFRYFRKTNGELWTFSDGAKDGRAKLVLNKDITLVREPEIESHPWKKVVSITAGNFDEFRAGIDKYGTFREIAFRRIAAAAQAGVWNYHYHDAQIGTESDWLDVINCNGMDIISLKTDGTLWKCNFDTTPDNNRDVVYSVPVTVPRLLPPIDMTFSKVCLGRNSDWVGITTAFGGFTALAGDGSLWLWRFEPKYFEVFAGGDNRHNLLQQSRKPQYLGNIFDGAH